MAKKRNKKYQPREVRTPAYLFGIYPEMKEEAYADLDLGGYIPLDAISTGNGSLTNVEQVMSALRCAYTLSAAFENKEDIRMLCYLATAGLAAAAGEMDAREPVTSAYLDPARDVIGLLGEMQRQCDRKMLVQSVRATMDNRRNILKLAYGAAHIVDPADKPMWEPLIGKVGMAYLNGMGRTGYLNRNDAMERLEWVDPQNSTTVPVHGDTIVVLEKPIDIEGKKDD